MVLSNAELKVENLINFSETEQVWLPEFQRPFVWDKNQVRLLIDSLYHNYTISSILLWQGGDELARRRVGASIKDIKVPSGSSEQVYYLLDGQQRTTALTLAFTDKAIYRGNNVKKKEQVNIYWDTEYKGDDPEMRWVLDDEKIQNLENPEEMIVLRDYSEKELFLTFGSRFIKIKHAYQFNDSDAEEWFEGEDEVKKMTFLYKYNQQLSKLKEHVLLRKVYDIEQKGTLEQVLEVFERINTKNTKLSIFDIMVAKTYRKYENGYFDLRSYYKVINSPDAVHTDFFENLERIDLDKVHMIVDESFMLQLTMIILKKQFKATEILKIKTEDLLSNTKFLHDRFHLLVGFMHKNFNIEKEDLNAYLPIMKFLAAAISHYDDITVAQQDMLRSWFWNTLLKNRYPGAQNERIAKDYKTIVDNTSEDKCKETFLRDNTRSFDSLKPLIEEGNDDNMILLDAYYSNRSQQIYRALLLLLKSQNAQDFYNGLIPARSGASEHKLEEHHIFPKNSTLGKEITEKYKEHRYNDIINNLANISLITKKTNNKKISNKLPSVYIAEFESEYKEAGKYEEFLTIMKSQFIDADMIEMLKKDEFEKFIIARTRLLYKEIEKLCQV